MSSHEQGLTLLELLIVLAIISILAAISYPVYQQHALKTRRTLAKISLMRMAAALENYYGVHNSYEDAKLSDINLPSSAADNSYQLEITTTTASTFVLHALPVGAQTADYRCGSLGLNEKGEKSISGSGRLTDCW